MGLTGQRQLQGVALGLTPDLVPQGGVGGIGKRPQSGVMGAEFLGARVSMRALPAAPCCACSARPETPQLLLRAEFPPSLTWGWERLEMCLKPSVVEGAVSAHRSPFSCTEQPSQETFCLLFSSAWISWENGRCPSARWNRAKGGGAVSENPAEGGRRRW